MRKSVIAFLLCAAALHAQDHLKNFRNKTAKQIANVSHLLRMDTTFFHVRIGEKGRDLAAAIEARGLTPRDFATIKAALDTSIFRQNRLIFPPGTFPVDSLGIYDPITLSGVGIRRIKPGDTTYYGSIIKSTNTTGLSLLKVLESGVFLHDLSLEGTKTDGHGFYSQRQPVSGSVNTTLGGYGLARVNSYNHGGSGFYIVGADGNLFTELESFDNRGYGVVITSPEEAGLVNAGVTAAGTSSRFDLGRSRHNKLGGWLIDDQAAVGLNHIEAIQDTTVGVWFKNGRSRSYMIAADVELQTPALVSSPATYGVRVEDMAGFLMAQSFMGTQHAFGSFTADAGTNTTTIVDAALINYGPDDYFVGSDVRNSSRSSGEVKITDYVASTGTLTLASAIASQAAGDTFAISKDQNVGLRLSNLTSGVFINNSFGSNVDTMVATVGDGGALFINNINFDPEDNLKEISGNFKWLYINTANVDSLSGGANTILMKSSNDFIIQSLDSLLLKSTGASKGIELASLGKIAIQPYSSAGVHVFGQTPNNTNSEFRIYYDADTSAAIDLNYVTFFGNTSQPNVFSIQNNDADMISFGAPVRFSGQNQTERLFQIQNQSNGTSVATPSSGNVVFYARGDTAYVKDDNGVERSLYAASGSGAPTSSGYITKTADATLSNEFALSSLATGLLRNTTTTGVPTSITTLPGLSTALTDFDLTGASAGNTIVRRSSGVWVDSTIAGGSGISTATARANTGWTSDGTTAQDTLAYKFRIDNKLAQFQVVDADNDSVLAIPQSLYPINYKDGSTQLWAVDSTGAMALADGVKQTFNPNGTTAGLNVGSHTSAPSSLANGDIWYNSTTNLLMGRQGGVSYPIVNDYDPSSTFAIYDDFITGSANTSGAMGSANWQRTIATSGTTTHQDGEAGRPGLMQLFCANSAGSTAALHSHTTSFKLAGNEYYKGSVKLSSLGTAGTNGALYRFGWSDGTGTAYPSNGVWIEFNVDSSATRWRAISANGGTKTITTYTGSTVSATTWYKLEILVNSNATSIDFSVDGTVIATHTTNIPTSNGIGCLMFAGAVTASATKNALVDYVLYMTSGLSR